MSHWAELDENNIVLRVTVGDNDDPNGDEGYQWLIDNLGGRWVKTSYNSYGGKRRDPITNEIVSDNGFRKNFAYPGHYYDDDLDAFIPPKTDLNPSWIVNPETGLWEPPIPYPTTLPQDGYVYAWSEGTLSWVEVTE